MTTPAATTEEALKSLQIQINTLNETLGGLQKNINVLDGNLQKIYAAFNGLQAARTQPAPGVQPGGWL